MIASNDSDLPNSKADCIDLDAQVRQHRPPTGKADSNPHT